MWGGPPRGEREEDGFRGGDRGLLLLLTEKGEGGGHVTTVPHEGAHPKTVGLGSFSIRTVKPAEGSELWTVMSKGNPGGEEKRKQKVKRNKKGKTWLLF
jgi:hypothetical protein